MIAIHRKDIANRDEADAILSTLRLLLEEKVSGFTETHGPDEGGWVYVEFDSLSGKKAVAAVTDCLDGASDRWQEYFDPPTSRTVGERRDD